MHVCRMLWVHTNVRIGIVHTCGHVSVFCSSFCSPKRCFCSSVCASYDCTSLCSSFYFPSVHLSDILSVHLYVCLYTSVYLCASTSVCTIDMERSGSVVECLTRDRGAAGSSLTGVTALWSFSTGSTQEDPSLFN